MASYYSVASGNWSSAAVWSSTVGGAGGAGVPTYGDVAWIESGTTVALNSGDVVSQVLVDGGTLNQMADMTGIISMRGGTYNSNNYTMNISAWGIAYTGGTMNLGTSTMNLYVSGSRNDIFLMNPSTTYSFYQNTTLNINIAYSGTPATIYFGNANTVNWGTINITSTVAGAEVIFQSTTGATSTVRNLSISGTVQVDFTASCTYRISNSLTTSGGKLRSTTPGTRYTLSSATSQTVYSTDIEDSAAAGGGTFIAYASTDSGNNSGWSFLNAPPSVTLSSPLDSSTVWTPEPQFTFIGADLEGNSITYEIQVDITATFDSQGSSPIIDALSSTSSGFSNITTGSDTDPFTSGNTIGYMLQIQLDDKTTYYWRVRGKDPTGSNTFGAWSATRSFVSSLGGTNFLFFFNGL